MATQERGVRTQVKVLEAAADVIDRRGYASASIAEILEVAGVTKGAMYFHFPSKQHIARGVMQAQTTFEDIPEDESPLQSIINLTHHLALRLQDNVVLRASIRLTIEHGSFDDVEPDSPYHWWLQRFTRRFLLAKGAGELRDGVTPEEAAETIVGSFSGIQLLSQVLDGRRDLVRRITVWWKHLLPGLASEAVLPRLCPEGTLDRPVKPR